MEGRSELGAALRELRLASGRSQDLVAHYGWAEDARISGSIVGMAERGEKRPSYKQLLAILRGIGTPEEDWPEIVRLHVTRGRLDPREVGVEQALANLRGLTSDADGADPPPPEDLGPEEGPLRRELGDVGPTRQGLRAPNRRATRGRR